MYCIEILFSEVLFMPANGQCASVTISPIGSSYKDLGIFYFFVLRNKYKKREKQVVKDLWESHLSEVGKRLILLIQPFC